MDVLNVRLIEAAERVGDDPGWNIKILTAGVQITYTWQHVTVHPFTNRPMLPGKFYTVESTTGWGAIQRARANPLLIAMNDLRKQATEFKP